MSGLAAGIRLAHFGQRVCIFERHNAPGGLNGFYSFGGRKFDVGLHAVTNFVRPGVKGTPLGKLLRQLRIDRDEWDLCEQKRSRIAFGPRGEVSLCFTNDFSIFESEIAQRFPSQIDGFRNLVNVIRAYDDVSLDAAPVSARNVVRGHITDRLLEEMLFCPLMYYGSAQERDMEFGQFAIMFKALFIEGFARPFEGVRRVLKVLLEKYRMAGGERRMKCGVRRLHEKHGRVCSIELDSGECITATHVLSSIGVSETMALLSEPAVSQPPSSSEGRRLSYVETISVLDTQPADIGLGDDTIVFYNDSPKFDYACPDDAVDPRSGVICIPNNFQYGEGRMLEEGWFRCTCLANYERWANMSQSEYRENKRHWFEEIQTSAKRFLHEAAGSAALSSHTVATDMFTPMTVERFTGHMRGAIYGSPQKVRTGRTPVANLYLCGTDQGFLGIIGAMLSGISMANYHILQPASKH